MNPFLSKYTTPYSTHPFDEIKIEHFMPAIKQGIEEENREIEAITENTDVPTFENTVVALENTGSLLGRVTEVMYNLLSAETCDELEELSQEVSPMLTDHGNDINFNMKLFQRVKAVYEEYESKGFDGLNKEERRLLETCYKGVVRHGANLSEEDKERMREVSTELSKLTLQFSQNKLKETNDFTLHIEDEADLEGLPESARDAASQEAKDRNMTGWVFTLHAPSYVPFMTYSAKRDLRKQMYMAYNTICTHDNKYNNVELCQKLINLRLEYARILGYKTYADFVLEERMAENTDNVNALLRQLIEAYKPTAVKEIEEVKKFADSYEKDRGVSELMPWDFSFYSNKLKEEKYSINSEAVRPYFELEKVKAGVFGLAEKLYGITFRLNGDIPVYHKDVDAYEVYDKNGEFLAVFYCDFFPRASKSSGAWMTCYSEQWIDEKGVNHRPHVSIVTNFTKPTDEKPSLLTLGEVETFLHEFGHSLHGMFANTTFKGLSGTNVYWDFVELPSQFMENYSIEREFLNTFAYHYETGERMPDELIERIVASRNFNVAYACMRQVSFGLLDMAYYTITEPLQKMSQDEFAAYEREAWKDAQVLTQIEDTCMTVQFGHIMAGGYSAGYYSYKWAEVLDADAFSLFQEKGIFDKETADSFRENVLSKGNTEHPMTLYKRFRGQLPSIKALLKRNGIVTTICCLLVCLGLSSCTRGDDLDEIFTAHTWYITGGVMKGIDIQKGGYPHDFYKSEDNYMITFSNNKFVAKLGGDNVITGTWQADGQKRTLSMTTKTKLMKSSELDEKLFQNILNKVTSYKGDSNILYIMANESNYLVVCQKRSDNGII